jgi:hypothetical protein
LQLNRKKACGTRGLTIEAFGKDFYRNLLLCTTDQRPSEAALEKLALLVSLSISLAFDGD